MIVLDPGHGGQDSGAMCGSLMEKDLTLDVALRAKSLLRASGYTAILTRDRDRYLSLAERAAVGNKLDDSLFVSIHFNDGKGATASGVETYYALRRPAARSGLLAWLPFWPRDDSGRLVTRSQSLADFIQSALVERTRAINRGIKSEQYYVIANVRHPAALVEGGFITNSQEVTKLASEQYRQQIANAIRDGVERYHHAVLGSEPTLAYAAAPAE